MAWPFMVIVKETKFYLNLLQIHYNHNLLKINNIKEWSLFIELAASLK